VLPGGRAESRQGVAPWIFDGYAPVSGVVTTNQDLATFATAMLRGKAPGLSALTPLADADDADQRIGCFWFSSTVGEDRRRIVWHNGMTGGYAAFVGFDLERGRRSSYCPMLPRRSTASAYGC